MLQITTIIGAKIAYQNNFNEPNPYRLLLDLVKQAQWPLDMVEFSQFPTGVVARLDGSEKREIVVQH